MHLWWNFIQREQTPTKPGKGVCFRVLLPSFKPRETATNKILSGRKLFIHLRFAFPVFAFSVLKLSRFFFRHGKH